VARPRIKAGRVFEEKVRRSVVVGDLNSMGKSYRTFWACDRLGVW